MTVNGWTDKKLEKFRKWLQTNGAELLPPTNTYEAIRFKAKETGILYTSGNTNSPYTYKAIKCYKSALSWDGRPDRAIRDYSTIGRKRKQQLLDRDGDMCFYCDEALGEDITIEHLLSITRGGPNYLSNMVLAHEACNKEVDNMTVSEKVNHAIKKRSK